MEVARATAGVVREFINVMDLVVSESGGGKKMSARHNGKMRTVSGA
jgi:hypothetical protein